MKPLKTSTVETIISILGPRASATLENPDTVYWVDAKSRCVCICVSGVLGIGCSRDDHPYNSFVPATKSALMEKAMTALTAAGIKATESSNHTIRISEAA